MQNPVVRKKLGRQFFEFLTERASKCIICQREWLLSTPYRVSILIVFFSREQQLTTAALSTDDHSIIRDTACPDYRTLTGPNSV
jgi:hypothetical protein